MIFSEQFIQEVADTVAQKVALLLGGKPGPRLLTVEAAAVYLSRTSKAVRGLIAKGIIPASRLDGRIQIDRQQLDKVIDGSNVWAI